MNDRGLCKSCGAVILWAITPKGRRLPVDPDPRPDGNVLVSDLRDVDGRYPCAILAGDMLADAQLAGAVLRVSHFATCPNARAHRRRDR